MSSMMKSAKFADDLRKFAFLFRRFSMFAKGLQMKWRFDIVL